jgi:hypothetical protein
MTSDSAPTGLAYRVYALVWHEQRPIHGMEMLAARSLLLHADDIQKEQRKSREDRRFAGAAKTNRCAALGWGPEHQIRGRPADAIRHLCSQFGTQTHADRWTIENRTRQDFPEKWKP